MRDGLWSSSNSPLCRHGAAETGARPPATDPQLLRDRLYQATRRPCGWDTGCPNLVPVQDMKQRGGVGGHPDNGMWGFKTHSLWTWSFLACLRGGSRVSAAASGEAARQEVGGPRGAKLGCTGGGSGRDRGPAGGICLSNGEQASAVAPRRG